MKVIITDLFLSKIDNSTSEKPYDFVPGKTAVHFNVILGKSKPLKLTGAITWEHEINEAKIIKYIKDEIYDSIVGDIDL